MSPIVRAAASYPRKHSDCPCSRVISRWLWWRRYWWWCWISLVSFQTTRTHVISENVQCHNKVQNSPTPSTTTTTGPSNYLQSDPMVNSSPRRKEGHHPNSRGLRPPVGPPTTFSDFNSQEATVVWAKSIFHCVPSIAQVLPRIAQVFPKYCPSITKYCPSISQSATEPSSVISGWTSQIWFKSVSLKFIQNLFLLRSHLRPSQEKSGCFVFVFILFSIFSVKRIYCCISTSSFFFWNNTESNGEREPPLPEFFSFWKGENIRTHTLGY